MPLVIGTEPDTLDVILVPGADLVETVETLNADMTGPQPWPVGTVITLEFGDPPPFGTADPLIVWTAVVDTNLLSWNVQSDDVMDLIESGYTTARLWYVNGTVRVPLAIGQVQVFG